MNRIHHDFSSILNGFNLETLENNPNSIFGLSTDLNLIYLNPGWFDFAKENNGEPAISEKFRIGTHIGEAMVGSVRNYYLETYQSILQAGRVWRHVYECSSPETFRSYHQTAYPLYNRNGLIIVNSLIVEQPHDANLRRPCQPIKKHYTQETGFINQCSNCRRVQLVSQKDVWDWVPAWVVQIPENTSHTLCQICYEYYYVFKY